MGENYYGDLFVLPGRPLLSASSAPAWGRQSSGPPTQRIACTKAIFAVVPSLEERNRNRSSDGSRCLVPANFMASCSEEVPRPGSRPRQSQLRHYWIQASTDLSARASDMRKVSRQASNFGVTSACPVKSPVDNGESGIDLSRPTASSYLQ